MTEAFTLYGLTKSYFTRKMTAYLDYKGIAYRFRRGGLRELAAEGFPGGVPAMRTPEGTLMWDSTSMIHYLEARFPEPAIFPPDPTQRLVDYLIEDYLDEWMYRPAVGTRWHYEENARCNRFELGREIAMRAPLGWAEAGRLVQAHVMRTLAPLGITEGNVQAWVDEVLVPWLERMDALLAERPCCAGGRPGLADFAVAGACHSHFFGDPACRTWMERHAPRLLEFCERMLEPAFEDFGDWGPARPSPAQEALLAEVARVYWPWSERALADGRAPVAIRGGTDAIASDFLRTARAELRARRTAFAGRDVDALLERAGLAKFLPEDPDASPPPVHADPPRPADNRPFGATARRRAKMGGRGRPRPGPK